MEPFSRNLEMSQGILKIPHRSSIHLVFGLKPDLIQDWEHLITVFNRKSLCGQENLTLVELGYMQKFPGEDLDLYVRRFYEKGLYCCDAVDQETMADLLLHGMTNDYHVYLENLTVPSFSKLRDVARTNESPQEHHGQACQSPVTIPRSFPRKGLVVVAVEDNQEVLPSRPKKLSFRQSYKFNNR